MADILPNFIGIGAPKCGTTWLARCLGEHPEVFMAAVKEVEFWKHENARDRLAEYAAHFAGAGNAKAIGEFSVRYLSFPGVPERIHEVLPGAKLIVSLRNPIEQVASNFWHLHRQRFNLLPGEPVPQSIAEVLADDGHREFLLGPARYAGHLAPFYRLFPREQIHVIRFDDIVSGPAGALHDLYAFLGIDPEFEAPSLNERGISVRRGTSPKNAQAARMHERIYEGLVNRVYNPLKRSIGVRRASKLKEVLHVRPVMEKLFMKKGYPPPTERERAELHREFAEEIDRVEKLTGLGLSSWRM